MFKIGDKVVCVEEPFSLEKEIFTDVPKVDEYYKINYIGENGWIGLEEMPQTDYYDYICFRKLDDTFATETLERISYEVEQEELVCL